MAFVILKGVLCVVKLVCGKARHRFSKYSGILLGSSLGVLKGTYLRARSPERPRCYAPLSI